MVSTQGQTDNMSSMSDSVKSLKEEVKELFHSLSSLSSRHVSLEDLSVSRAACSQGDRKVVQSIKRALWEYPSYGILKLNFNRSFIK